MTSIYEKIPQNVTSIYDNHKLDLSLDILRYLYYFYLMFAENLANAYLLVRRVMVYKLYTLVFNKWLKGLFMVKGQRRYRSI